ncbi:hypothetical protein J6590_060621 [Homalodisca vitripennis]|nr:hypothetical protein J6590_060621 [Homalodisca vitripennis]
MGQQCSRYEYFGFYKHIQRRERGTQEDRSLLQGGRCAWNGGPGTKTQTKLRKSIALDEWSGFESVPVAICPGIPRPLSGCRSALEVRHRPRIGQFLLPSSTGYPGRYLVVAAWFEVRTLLPSIPGYRGRYLVLTAWFEVRTLLPSIPGYRGRYLVVTAWLEVRTLLPSSTGYPGRYLIGTAWLEVQFLLPSSTGYPGRYLAAAVAMHSGPGPGLTSAGPCFPLPRDTLTAIWLLRRGLRSGPCCRLPWD